MKRVDLLRAMKIARPALARTDDVPAFSCYFLDGARLTACNGYLTVSTPLESEVFVGFPGKQAAAWLGACAADDVGLKDEGKALRLTAGRSRLKLVRFELGELLFKWPDVRPDVWSASFTLDPEFYGALERVAACMGDDPGHLWRMGVTLVARSDKIVLYATDDASMCRASAVGSGADGAVVLPPHLVSVLLEHRLGPGRISFDEEQIVVVLDEGTRLWSTTVAGPSPGEYARFMAGYKDVELVEVPPGLEAMIERALVLLGAKTDVGIRVKIEGGKLRMGTRSELGGLLDYADVPGHPDVEVRFDPANLKRWLPYARRLAFTSSGIVLSGKRSRALVALL